MISKEWSHDMQNLIWMVILLDFPNQAFPLEYTCDFHNDIKCPASWQFDGECDQEIFGCHDGDCWDCDPCHEFNYDCESCIVNGCLWCESDALCSSQALDVDNYWKSHVEDFLQRSARSACGTQDYASHCPTSSNTNVFTDPLYDAMKWSYELINVEDVWKQGITGAGVTIVVNDVDGIDVNHPEFIEKFDRDASCPPELSRSAAGLFHGTAAASIAVASANNDHCAAGIAPGASVALCTLPVVVDVKKVADIFSYTIGRVDISLNAWGINGCFAKSTLHYSHRRQQSLPEQCPFEDIEIPGRSSLLLCDLCDFSGPSLSAICETGISQYCLEKYEENPILCAEYLDLFVQCRYNTLPAPGHAALIRGVQEGRNGKGIIYVFASGNEYNYGADVNFEGWLNTRFTISVGAVGKDGKHASYSSPGAALFLTAPGGDKEHLSNNIVAMAGGDCVDGTYGTSFSCPVVAGVVALLLETNPNLGWRDVQGILAKTAQRTHSKDESWATNAAGFHHSNLYGFGVVDASAAVHLAKDWTNFGVEKQIIVRSGLVNASIADNTADVASSTVTLGRKDLIAESVVVYLDLRHPSRGDLKIELKSPEGTISVLHPSNRPENSILSGEERWKFMTVRNWGEDPHGEWTISLTDETAGVWKDCVDTAWTFEMNDDAFDDPFLITCNLMNSFGYCREGRVMNQEFGAMEDGIESPARACCVCGGGVQADHVHSVLASWVLVVYGRDNDDDGSPNPGDFSLSLTPIFTSGFRALPDVPYFSFFCAGLLFSLI